MSDILKIQMEGRTLRADVKSPAIVVMDLADFDVYLKEHIEARKKIYQKDKENGQK
jgi:superfamily II DNA or RNA helicase